MTPEELRSQKIRSKEKDTCALIERDFSASRMNTTKWAEVAEGLAEVAECLPGLRVQCRFKFVDVPDKAIDAGWFRHVTDDWFDSFNVGPFTTVLIEWLDINPIEYIWRGALVKPAVVNHTIEIEKRLQAISVPYHWAEGNIRIVGHVRKGTSE